MMLTVYTSAEPWAYTCMQPWHAATQVLQGLLQCTAAAVLAQRGKPGVGTPRMGWGRVVPKAGYL